VNVGFQSADEIGSGKEGLISIEVVRRPDKQQVKSVIRVDSAIQ